MPFELNDKTRERLLRTAEAIQGRFRKMEEISRKLSQTPEGLEKLSEIAPGRHRLSGAATHLALKDAVAKLKDMAPEDHDVVVVAWGIRVKETRLLDPETFLFTGFDEDGHSAFAIAHFTQLVTKVIHCPPRSPDGERTITGFGDLPKGTLDAIADATEIDTHD